MAKRPQKVFRTAIGFEDAYVAASSRRAALKAWGTDKDLFARGVAEQVTDHDLAAKALERPGEVIRLPRASVAQHLAAAKPAEPTTYRTSPNDDEAAKRSKRRAPKPSRTKVDSARSALEKLEECSAGEIAGIDEEIAKLRQRKVELQERNDNRSDELRAALERAEDRYRAALDQWEG